VGTAIPVYPVPLPSWPKDGIVFDSGTSPVYMSTIITTVLVVSISYGVHRHKKTHTLL